MSIYYPQGHLDPPKALNEYAEPWAAYDEHDRALYKAGVKPMTNNLIARGFRIDKHNRFIRWVGPSGAKFSAWEVMDGDVDFSLDTIRAIISVFEDGASDYDTETSEGGITKIIPIYSP